MSDTLSSISSPESGETTTPARRRIIQLKTSSSSTRRSSMDPHLPDNSGSTVYNSQLQREKTNLSRCGRYSRPDMSSRKGEDGSNYYHSQEMNCKGPRATTERALTPVRGRSMSRSHSPRSPKSLPRSRSRSRSFSPRGHRSFIKWRQDRRSVGSENYSFERSERENRFDSRLLGRERDLWPRGGGRGRHTNYQRGNRFYPKEVRYKTTSMDPHYRSMSRDRGRNSGSGSVVDTFRDRQMHDRGQDQWDHDERRYRRRPRDRELSSRSLSLVRTSNSASDYWRESGLCASAEEGEEKSEEDCVATSATNVKPQAPIESDNINWDTTSATKGSRKHMSFSSTPALPPRPHSDSRCSQMVEDSDGNSSPDNKKEVELKAPSKSPREKKFEMGQAQSTASCAVSMELDEEKKKRSADTLHTARCANAIDTANDQKHANLMDKDFALAAQAQNAVSPEAGDSVQTEAQGDKDLSIKKTTEVLKADNECVSSANNELCEVEDRIDMSAKLQMEIASAVYEHVDVLHNVKGVLQKARVMSPNKHIMMEDNVQTTKEKLSLVRQQASVVHDLNHGADNKINTFAIGDSTAFHNENLILETKEHCRRELHEGKHAKRSGVTEDDMDDIGAILGSQRKKSGTDEQGPRKKQEGLTAGIEMKSLDADEELSTCLDENSGVIATQHEMDTNGLSTVLATEPKEVRISKDRVEEENGFLSMTTDNSIATINTTATHESLSDISIGKTAVSLSSCLKQDLLGKRVVNAIKIDDLSETERGHEKRAESSRTDPSSVLSYERRKPPSTSFSLQGTSNCEETVSVEWKGCNRYELTSVLKPEYNHTRDACCKDKDARQLHLRQLGGRPALDRSASLSMLPERNIIASSEARQGSGNTGGCRTSRFSSSINSKPFSKRDVCIESSAEDHNDSRNDAMKQENAVKKGHVQNGSVYSISSRRSFSAGERTMGVKSEIAEDKQGSKALEELPTLPDIPFPRGKECGPYTPMDLGEETLTKRHRPRLGWGQGLVAPTLPQPAKRPRIGWGQGLVQQHSDTRQSAKAAAVDEGNASVRDGSVKVEKTDASSRDDACFVDNAEAVTTELAMNGTSNVEMSPIVQLPRVALTPEKARFVSNKEPAATIVGESVDDSDAMKGGNIGNDAVAHFEKPSKEIVLSTIDILDSDILSVKKQIEALQETINNSEVNQDSTDVSLNTEFVSAGESAGTVELSKLGGVTAKVMSSNMLPTDASSAQPFSKSLVKLAMDSNFVDLLTNVFSENLRKITAANNQLPKRVEKGRIATKIYHQPSDYLFYQENIDRGSMLSNRVRLRVRMRNCARHEYLKKLAREYVDSKKLWKLGVKKMEKDRKRQEKLRLKQLQKEKLKYMGECGPIRTTNTIHQSPHVQQLVAAEKAAEAAGESTIVRSSSRLTNNSCADLNNNDLEKIEQAKAQAFVDQEIRKKRLKNALSTVIPDMIIFLEDRQQRCFTRFVNCQSCMADGLVTDWKLKEKAEMKVNPWNDLEKCIYVDKFLQFPKNFPRISSFLSNKSTGDVIAFYYRTKKVADYKALLREQQLRRRGAGSKNTWSCWNLSACAAICLGVQFPEHVAKLLLHPSNFRSHQASDNILNSAGARRLLRNFTAKVEETCTITNSNSVPSVVAAEGLSALDLVSGTNRTSSVWSSAEAQLEVNIYSGDSDTSDEETFSLYTQQLEHFVAGQQRPFLVDYASLLTDNSYSTGYEVSTLSVEERLKKYPKIGKELESTGDVAATVSAANTSKEAAKDKESSVAAGSSRDLKNGGLHITMKESKHQRKTKKTHEGADALTGTIALTSSHAGGGANGEKAGGHNKKKNASSVISVAGASTSIRGTPRISVPGEEKTGQSSKKSSRSGGGTPGVRRSSYSQSNVTSAPPKTSVASAVDMSDTLVTASTGEAAKKVSSACITPTANARSSSPSSNTIVGGNMTSAAAPAKRVVQKWTEGEKADFLKFFSQYGKDWTTLTENIPTKTAAQIKNYYQNYKNRLNLQDILKRRIESAATSGGGGGMSHAVSTSAVANGNIIASPRSAAAGLMSGTLRQMGHPVELPGGFSVGMPGGSMPLSASDMSMSFQAALNAAQPGIHGANGLPELPTYQFGMQNQQGQQQQQSREMMNTASNSERYLKLLNMQHQLQIMQFQQQQNLQGLASESGGVESNISYHESQMQRANAQRLYQFSRQQQHQVPPQHLSMQALQQTGLQARSQSPAHSRTMQLSMQHQHHMGHQSALYQPIGHMQSQHPQAVVLGAQMSMSPTNTQQYDRAIDYSTNAAVDGCGLTRGNIEISSGMIGHRDAAQRSSMNITMINAAGGNGSTLLSGAASNSPRQIMISSRSSATETSRPQDIELRQSAWHSALVSAPSNGAASAGYENDDTLATLAPSVVQDNALNVEQALAAPPVQAVRSRMSFSSILNESESPRDNAASRGSRPMVTGQQESPCMSEQQRRQQLEHLQREQQQQCEQKQREQEQMQQRRHPPLHLEHARAMATSAELAQSSGSAPSPTAHLLPRRPSVSVPHSRMGLMSNLLNIQSPERRTSTQEHQSPLVHQQQPMQHHMRSACYYDANGSSADSAGTASHGAVVSTGSGIPVSSTVLSTIACKTSSSEHVTSRPSSMVTSYSNNTSTMALSHCGSASSASSVSSNAPLQGGLRAQQQMWNYTPQIRFEEAELLRRAQRAEEEAARAAAAAAVAARALQEAQQARQQALDMAANMARYNSAIQQQQQMQQQRAQQQQAQQQQAQQQQAQQQQAQQQQAQQQQAQQQQAQQQQAQQQQAQQQQAQQQYQLQAHHHQQMHQQQQLHHEYQQQHQAQQLQQQQHQALHHHLQLMQQQQQRSGAPSSECILQQQLHQQQPSQRAPQPDR